MGRLVWELSENVRTATTKIIGKNNLLVGSWGRKCPDAPTNLIKYIRGSYNALDDIAMIDIHVCRYIVNREELVHENARDTENYKNNE